MGDRYIEHIPRAYYKSDWIQFEEEYPAFFELIASLKSRWTNCEDVILSVNKIWIHRWVNGDIEINKMYIPYYDVWFALFGRFSLCNVKGWSHCVPQLIRKTVYHHWICNWESNRLASLKSNLNGIFEDKPLTFNINDDYPDTEYHEHQRQFTMAMEQYFPIKSPLERSETSF